MHESSPKRRFPQCSTLILLLSVAPLFWVTKTVNTADTVVVEQLPTGIASNSVEEALGLPRVRSAIFHVVASRQVTLNGATDIDSAVVKRASDRAHLTGLGVLSVGNDAANKIELPF
jgi:hypothetical protein